MYLTLKKKSPRVPLERQYPLYREPGTISVDDTETDAADIIAAAEAKAGWFGDGTDNYSQFTLYFWRRVNFDGYIAFYDWIIKPVFTYGIFPTVNFATSFLSDSLFAQETSSESETPDQNLAEPQNES